MTARDRRSPGSEEPHGYRLQAGQEPAVERWLETEWLLTNGAGGYAMGTALGARTRRYHGLLVAHAPGRAIRMLSLASIAERVVLSYGQDSQEHDLSTFLFSGTDPDRPVLHPRGDRCLVSFEKNHVCRWVYRPGGAPGVEIVKECTLVRHAPACLVRYSVRALPGAKQAPRVSLLLRPLLTLRDHHGLTRKGEADHQLVPAVEDGGIRVRDHAGSFVLLRASAGMFRPDEQWWYNFQYPREQERGLPYIEDLYSPGEFLWESGADGEDATVTLQASMQDSGLIEFDAEVQANGQRIASVISAFSQAADSQGGTRPIASDRLIARLGAASDDYVIRTAAGTREGTPECASIIAGYPWFSDWGRDTMICLPGLLLEAGQYAEALGALSRFARARKNGIIPNLFNDQTGEPEYNTVDASLWFIIAACRYRDASGDREGFHTELEAACLDIVQNYRRGTDFNIGMDPADRLISAGTEATQLTWMDARRDGVVFTPRHGKPVEVCSLWCSALAMLADAVSPGDSRVGSDLRSLSEAACTSFRAEFWNEANGCCHDVLTPVHGGWRPNSQIRPNQVFGASLPHAPLRREQALAMLAVIDQRLLTPRGLRTLDPRDPAYRGRFAGSLFERDAAYHNGTAWPWLLGPYAEAIMRVDGFSAASCQRARAVLEPMMSELDGLCLGQLAEVYDGDAPQRPGGCPAQAWSVAELLRVYLMAVRAREHRVAESPAPR